MNLIQLLSEITDREKKNTARNHYKFIHSLMCKKPPPDQLHLWFSDDQNSETLMN